MAEERPLVDEVLDYAFYAPLGMALSIVEDLPALVARGRRQVEGQFGVARFVGKIALSQLRNRVDAFLETSDPVVTTPRPTESVKSEPSEGRRAAAARVASEDLAIAGYDSLAASQVVARLATLDVDELRAIRSYERATRGRQTILARIAQLGVADD
jgi:hypothetical protein